MLLDVRLDFKNHALHCLGNNQSGKDIKMTIARQRHAHHGLIFALFTAAFRKRPTDRLDVQALSDHLKRDLGFLDGRDPPSSMR
jgi:hypothetical protein